MKFIKFPEANDSVQVVNGDPLHYYHDDLKNVVLCVEIDKDDLKFIRNRGRVYVLLQGFNSPPPIGVIAYDPFNPNQPHGKDENTNQNGPGHNGQSHNGDSKLS